jgi:hypothetical protein
MSVPPYAALLDAIGFYVERANGTDVLVNEIEGGVLVAFLTDTDQQVVTLDDTELAQLRAEIAARAERPRLGIRLRGLLGHTGAVTGGPAPAGPLQPTDQTGPVGAAPCGGALPRDARRHRGHGAGAGRRLRRRVYGAILSIDS